MTQHPGRKRVTAEELMHELSADPEWFAGAKWRERQAEARSRELAALEAPVVAELRRLGFKVDLISDLHNSRLNYQAAIPLLMSWLPRVADRRVKEEIIRALSVRWAKPQAAPLLLEEFRNVEDDPQGPLRWAIGNALEVVADESFADDLIDLVRDATYGRSRQMIVLALGRMKARRPVQVLIDLLGDEDVAAHAVIALGKLGAPEAKPALERMLTHRDGLVRKEAKKALGRIS